LSRSGNGILKQSWKLSHFIILSLMIYIDLKTGDMNRF
jgi:hypothetical protein